MKSFDNGILVGEIVNVCADESVLTDGKIDPKKLKPIAFDPVNNTYLAMGDKVGDAFGSGKALKYFRFLPYSNQRRLRYG